MASFRPRSILQLTITGFLLVTVLLVAAVVVMAHQLDTLSGRSQVTVDTAAEAMRSGRELVEQIMTMERNARQYTVLLDDDLLDVYVTRRKQFTDAAGSLKRLGIGKVNDSLDTLLLEEKKAYEALTQLPVEKDVTAVYPQLLNTAYQISYDLDEWVDYQQELLRLQTDRAQDLLTIQALFLVSTSLLLAGLFTILITRPLQQIEHAINQLGGGSYETPIQIHGPTDLQELGTSLDWLRNRLSELEQQHTFFMHHVSHELKTPLTAIQEGTALLNDGVVGRLNSQQYEITRILRTNCRRLQGQIENLLRYTVDSLTVLKPMPHPVRLDEVIEHVITDHELVIKSRQIHIIQQFEKVTVHGDAEQLRVIVDNLLANAVKYSPQGGKILIRLTHDRDLATMEIADEGPGVPVEERSMIFEAFYQGLAPERQHLQGTGLGLAITREYVKLNNGTIEVVDNDSGTGACFRVKLPLSRQA